MSTELMSLTEMEKAANMIVKSKLFPGIASVEAAVTLMMICQAEKIPPIMATRRYHIVKGQPAMKADAMLGEFQSRGGKVEWVDFTDDKVTAIFHAPGLIKPTPPVSWDMSRAKKADLLGNPTWNKYPRNMLRARVISDGIRMAMPEIIAGIYTPEEVEDFPEPKKKESYIYESHAEPIHDTKVIDLIEESVIEKIIPTDDMKRAAIEEIMNAKTLDELIDAGKEIAIVTQNWDEKVKKDLRLEFDHKKALLRQLNEEKQNVRQI